MFVKTNTLSAIKDYFNANLSDLYSSNELKVIVKELSIKRFNIRPVEYLHFTDSKLSESDLLYFYNALKRLKLQEPFQYVLGETWFYDLNLKIDSRALIPRPETEELVDWATSDFKTFSKPVIMDLCSGSGCIALALKNNLPSAFVTAIEFSKDAIDLIRENKKQTKLDIEVVEMDVLNLNHYSNFKSNSFDCWISNPPYIPEKEKTLMAVNVLEHEPEMALFVENDDPLVFYRGIGKQSQIYLKEGGVLYFEINENLGEETVDLLKQMGFVNIELRKDLQGRDRMVKARKVSSRHERK